MTNRRLLRLSLLVLALTAALPLRAQQGTTAQATPEYGPAKGTLVIIGGNMSDNFGVPQKFIQLAGGANRKFVIVPTNGGNRTADGTPREYKADSVLAPWKKRGLTNVVMLHTWDPKVADTPEFVAPLLDADAVWFDGGRQWNAVDSYMNTRALKEFWNVLNRGGVIAGSSVPPSTSTSTRAIAGMT